MDGAAMTEWRDIPGYEGYYQVSDDGQVKALARDVLRREGMGQQRYRERIRKLASGTGGYLTVTLYRGDGGKTCGVHQLVALAFLGGKPFGGAYVLHGDGDPTNNHVENLRWGTNSENQLDAVMHGTHATASRTHCIRNHPFDAVNTKVEITKSGSTRRVCRACLREKAAKISARKRAERNTGNDTSAGDMLSSRSLYGAKHGRFARSPLDWAKCGTDANYRAHHRRGEKACAACSAAHARKRADSTIGRAVS
jgi:hypothetical protein